ncbi:unnamed protein product, partial [Heterosigma akashiwo]
PQPAQPGLPAPLRGGQPEEGGGPAHAVADAARAARRPGQPHGPLRLRSARAAGGPAQPELLRAECGL